MRKLYLLLCGIVFFAASAMAQKTITGKVTDEKGNPLEKVSVLVKGTSVGTATNAAGQYTLKVSATAKALVFSYTDMMTEDVTIGSQTVINHTMKAEDKALSEVVVTGYGTQKKREFSGNVASVKGAAVADKPVQSFEQALAGRAPGVQITVPNGVLNTPPVFRIRGTNSISLSSYPLIIVDGIPVATGDFSSTNSAGNALASINPNDIESIDIAKDAAASAIYGSRAANGVVFITTKKGRAGKPRVSYSGNMSWTKAYGIPQVLNAQQYTDYKNMAAANNPGVNSSNPSGSGYVHFAMSNDANGNPINTNWADYIYRTGFSHNNVLSVSGGNDNTTYYFSAGYTHQEGILKKNDFNRANMLFNINSNFSKMLQVGGKLSYSNEQNLAATTSGSLSGEAFNTGGLGRIQFVTAPNIAPYTNTGAYNITSGNIIGPMGNSVQTGFYNPVVVLDLNRSNSETNHIQSNVFVQFKPVNWLAFRTTYGIDNIYVDNDLYQTPLHGDGFSSVGNASSTFTKAKRYTWDNTLQADYTFGKSHTFSLLVGSEQDRRTGLGFGINRQNVSDPVYNLIQAGWGLNNTAATAGNYGENYLNSQFGRLNYDFKKKVYFSGNLRQDKYSAFKGKGETFYGFSLAYELAKERFFQNIGLGKFFNSFKLRASYGKVGNTAGIGDYATYSTYSSGLNGGAATLGFSQAGNPDLRWETSKKTDIGVSMGMLNDRVHVDFAWYKNNITDLILSVPQAPSAGLPSSVPMNVGTMFNRGAELQIEAMPVKTKNFTWNTTFNFAVNENKVTSLAPGLSEIVSSTSGLETVNRTAPGYSVGYLWLVRNGGVDPATGRRIFINSAGQKIYYQFYAPAGQYNFTTEAGTRYNNTDGSARTITQAADGVMYGNVVPKQVGGWDNTFRFKEFELSALLTYNFGFYVYYGSHAGLFDQRFWNNSVEVLNAWKKPGDVTNIPKPVYGDNFSNGSALPETFNAFKGDFVKLKNVTVAYNIPSRILSKARISSARFYLSGQNLAIFTKYPGPDPEVSSNGNSNLGQGVDRNTIANGRTIVVGLNVGF